MKTCVICGKSEVVLNDQLFGVLKLKCLSCGEIMFCTERDFKNEHNAITDSPPTDITLVKNRDLNVLMP